MEDLMQYLGDVRSRVEQWLDRALRPETDGPSALLEAMRYSLLAPGKRLRPALVLLATEAAGGDSESGLPAAGAVEMVHVYSLVHDDLPAMDDDDLRRGQPTCHKRFGEALAILAGDALLTRAFEELATHYPPTTAAACCRELARAAGSAGMVGGQVYDLAWERGGGTLDDLEQVHLHKTGALLCVCLRLGVLVAHGERVGGPDQDMLKRFEDYGRCVGLLFQITDDLLDVEGDAEQTGKRVGKDAARGKLTYPRILGVDGSRQRATELAQQAAEHIRPLGERASRLLALLPTILERKR